MRIWLNWSGIKELRGEYPAFAQMLVSFTPYIPETLAGRFLRAFPEYFSETRVIRKTPLSLIRQKAAEVAMRDRVTKKSSLRGMFPNSYGVLEELKLPVIEFRTGPSEVAPDLPYHRQVGQGGRITVDDRTLVVLENNRNPGVNIMTLVPVELIDLSS